MIEVAKKISLSFFTQVLLRRVFLGSWFVTWDYTFLFPSIFWLKWERTCAHKITYLIYSYSSVILVIFPVISNDFSISSYFSVRSFDHCIILEKPVILLFDKYASLSKSWFVIYSRWKGRKRWTRWEQSLVGYFAHRFLNNIIHIHTDKQISRIMINKNHSS